MNFCLMHYMPTVFLLFFLNIVFAQVKIEKEHRVSEEVVPEIAVKQIRKFYKISKLKWFVEQSSEGLSYEAKFRVSGYDQISVEFDSLGKYIDAEILVKQEPEVKRILDSLYNKYKINRLQYHLEVSLDSLPVILYNREKIGERNDVLFEVELTIKEKDRWIAFEVLMDKKGKILRKREILQENDLNLDL
ncbi:MAG: hypothetical protein MRY83_00540 [Flavobacteriales bacterium]|nr:hypothetical protein [Flavobacteriales bacterium]